MGQTTPKDGKPGTTDQSPRWEGPEETRPRGYLPATDDPERDCDAAGENLNDPDRRTMGDAFAMREDDERMPEEESPGVLPKYTDPAFSNAPAGSPVQSEPPVRSHAPRDTEYEGHPDFSQDAAANKPPKGIGNSESVDDDEEETRHSDGVEPDRRTGR